LKVPDAIKPFSEKVGLANLKHLGNVASWLHIVKGFNWSKTQVLFQSLRGLRSDDVQEFSRWIFSPPEAARSISQQPTPVHVNLWPFKGREPKNAQELDIVIQRFSFW
jgi:hypothetical protein